MTQRAAIIAAMVILGCGWGASPARAGWRITRAEEIARIVWHTPAVDHMTVRWGPLPPGMSPDVAGWADIPNDTAWLTAGRHEDWEPFCSIVLHEAGHLAGMGHTNHGIMEADSFFVEYVNDDGTVDWYGTDHRCKHDGIPYLEEHGIAV